MERVRTILIVDDDRLLLEHVELTLKDAGYWILKAEDGKTAVGLAASTRLDLIILDSIMPEMDGLEVLRLLKSAKTTDSIPVMMLTARKEPKNVREALKRGAEDYIAKPVDPGKLLDRVRRLLEKVEKKKEVEGGMMWRPGAQLFDAPLKRTSAKTLGPGRSRK